MKLKSVDDRHDSPFDCIFSNFYHPQVLVLVLVRALFLVGRVVCVFLAVTAKFLLPECQFSYTLYENEDIVYIFSKCF